MRGAQPDGQDIAELQSFHHRTVRSGDACREAGEHGNGAVEGLPQVSLGPTEDLVTEQTTLHVSGRRVRLSSAPAPATALLPADSDCGGLGGGMALAVIAALSGACCAEGEPSQAGTRSGGVESDGPASVGEWSVWRSGGDGGSLCSPWAPRKLCEAAGGKGEIGLLLC